MSFQFVMACRHYNMALSCYRRILKLIDEFIDKTSISEFVTKIPDVLDDGENPKGISNKAQIFFQKACLSTFQKAAKRKIM